MHFRLFGLSPYWTVGPHIKDPDTHSSMSNKAQWEWEAELPNLWRKPTNVGRVISPRGSKFSYSWQPTVVLNKETKNLLFAADLPDFLDKNILL